MGRLSDEVLEDLIARQSRVIIIADGNDKDLMEYTENILKFLKELKEYRNICDSPEKLKLIDALYLERCEEINKLKAELTEIRNKTIEEFAEKFIYKAVCEGCSGCCNCYEKGGQSECEDWNALMKIAEKLKEVQDVN